MNRIRELSDADCIDGLEHAQAWNEPLSVSSRSARYLSRTFTPPGRPRRAVRAPAARSNAYPEGIEYIDQGCDLSPSCLDCPFTCCRYDHPRGARGIRSEQSRQEDHSAA